MRGIRDQGGGNTVPLLFDPRLKLDANTSVLEFLRAHKFDAEKIES